MYVLIFFNIFLYFSCPTTNAGTKSQGRLSIQAMNSNKIWTKIWIVTVKLQWLCILDSKFILQIKPRNYCNHHDDQLSTIVRNLVGD